MNEASGSHDLSILIRDFIRRLLPKAVFQECPDPTLRGPHCFFLQEGDNFFWVEAVKQPFTREGIPDYLTKSRRVQAAFPDGVSGILLAPHFEEGVPELFESVRFTVRLFRYQGNTGRLSVEAYPPAQPLSGVRAEETSTSWNRLTREELREFIDLDLELLSFDSHK